MPNRVLLPAPRPYTLEWTGALRVDRDGRHRFSLTSLGASAIWLDGNEVARKAVDDGIVDSDIELARGWHDIRIRFVDSIDFAYITAFWQPPGGLRAPLPPSSLRPWPADRVQAARPEDANPRWPGLVPFQDRADVWQTMGSGLHATSRLRPDRSPVRRADPRSSGRRAPAGVS